MPTEEGFRSPTVYVGERSLQLRHVYARHCHAQYTLAAIVACDQLTDICRKRISRKPFPITYEESVPLCARALATYADRCKSPWKVARRIEIIIKNRADQSRRVSPVSSKSANRFRAIIRRPRSRARDEGGSVKGWRGRKQS